MPMNACSKILKISMKGLFLFIAICILVVLVISNGGDGGDYGGYA